MKSFQKTVTVPQVSDFELISPISRGAYGRVYKVRKRTTGEAPSVFWVGLWFHRGEYYSSVHACQHGTVRCCGKQAKLASDRARACMTVCVLEWHLCDDHCWHAWQWLLVQFPPVCCGPPVCCAYSCTSPFAVQRSYRVFVQTPAGDLFAIKVMTKTDLVRKNMVESVTNERNILAMVSAAPAVTGRSAAISFSKI